MAAQQRLEAAQKATDDATQAAADATNLEQKGALGWSEHRNATLAQQVLTDPALSTKNPNDPEQIAPPDGGSWLQYTQRGNPKDATSLDNMLQAVALIQQLNQLRADEGLAPLQISDAAMAAAMVQANAGTKLVMKHNQVLPSNLHLSENLAWGYRDPLAGWWTAEKAIYEDALLSGKYPGLASMSPYQIYQKYPKLYKTIGYYLNCSDPNATATGIGVSQYPGAGHVPTSAMENSSHAISYDGVDDATPTDADVYQQELQEYVDPIRNAQQKLKDAQDALASAQTAQSDAEQAYDSALTKHEDAQRAKTAAQQQADAQSAKYAQASATLTDAQKAYDIADVAFTAAQRKADDAAKALDQANQNTDAAKTAKDDAASKYAAM